MSGKKYSIIHFVEGDSIEVLPTRWLLNKNTAKWPSKMSNFKIGRFIRECSAPESNWKEWEIKVLGSSNSFKKANKKAQKAQETSSLETMASSDTDINERRKVQKPVRFREESTDDDIPNCYNYKEPVSKKKRFETPSVPIITKVHPVAQSPLPESLPNYNMPNNCTIEGYVAASEVPSLSVADKTNASLEDMHLYEMITIDVPESVLPVSVVPESLPNYSGNTSKESSAAQEVSAALEMQSQKSSNNDFPLYELMSRMFTSMEKMRKDINELMKQQRELNSQFIKMQLESGKQIVNTQTANPIPDLVLPISTDLELMNLNSKLLSDQNLSTVLVCYLSNLAYGKCLSYFTTNLVKKFLVRDVALLYSRLGRKGKKSLEDLREVFNVLIATMSLRFPEAKREELSERLGKVLSTAKDWGVPKEKKSSVLEFGSNSLEFSEDITS